MKNPLTSTIILPYAFSSGGVGYGIKYNPNYTRVYLSFLYPFNQHDILSRPQLSSILNLSPRHTVS